ncbi:MAG: N-acetylmuramic acid 6-phosphate etherase [Parvularculaceae bacterium]
MKTESISERYVDLDRWPTEAAVEAMLEGQFAAVAAVSGETSAIAAAANAAADRLRAGGRLLYAGAGTSGRLAVQDGVELVPTFGWPAERLGFAIAGGFAALTTSAERAEDDPSAAKSDVRALSVSADDVLIAVAASGRTPYTLAAVETANAAGALTIAVVNNRPSPVLDAADIGVCAETGPEIVAGSTRMKAGTAQKVILNLISTAAMIRCGRVYKGLMVDMSISNDKLRRRAEAMIERLAHASPEAAARALNAAEGDVKIGVLTALGAPLSRAREILTDAGGDLRAAVDRLAAGDEEEGRRR